MKKTILIILLCIASSIDAQIQWMKLDKALELQANEPKKIMLFFEANWCSQCKKMKKNTFSQPDIYNYINENYYPVKIDIDTKEEITYKGRTYRSIPIERGKYEHEFVRYMNIHILPTTVFMDDKGNPITMIQARLTPDELMSYLTLFAHDDYKKFKSQKDWEKYQKKATSKEKR